MDECTLILISSLLAWDRTPKNLEEIKNPDEPDSDEEANKQEEVKEEGEKIEGEEGEAEMNEEEAGTPVEPTEENASEKEGEEGEEEKEGEEGEEEQEEDLNEPEAPKPKKRKRYLHHPFTEADFIKRACSEEYTCIKEVEDLVLSFKR